MMVQVMTRKFFCFLFFSLLFNFFYAEDVVLGENIEDVETVLDEGEEKKTLILYGLESDVIDLIKKKMIDLMMN